MAVATFGAGCFWGIEETYRRKDGVISTAVGYMGGHKDAPSYKDVCTDTTGHAEVVQVTYNPDEISYQEIVDIFFDNHNPTQLNRQGPDIGSQYRSVIFFHDDTQRSVAAEKKEALQQSGRFQRTIVTTVEEAQTFWIAEDYHQQYLAKRGLDACHI